MQKRSPRGFSIRAGFVFALVVIPDDSHGLASWALIAASGILAYSIHLSARHLSARICPYSGFQMGAPQLVRLRPRRQSLAGVSR
jgi:hypothetical protein